MLFSILIPTYNNEKTIAKTIESALNQDYNGDYEIVIVNNASTDSTLSIIQSYNDSRIKLFTNKTTVHMYENHNICIKKAQGEYVIFCHADDLLLPETLKILAKKIAERMFPQRYIVWGHSMFNDFSQSMQLYDTMLSYNTMFSGITAKKIFLGDGLTPSGTCYSKKIFADIGYFPVIEGTCDVDWVFGVIASFSGCEFEMLDRMLFYRMESSTYGESMKSEIREKMLKKAVLSLNEHLSDLQIKEIHALWKQYRYYILDYLFYKPETIEERKQRYIYEIKARPWSIRKIIRLLTLMINTR